jgi:hypothetical protein
MWSSPDDSICRHIWTPRLQAQDSITFQERAPGLLTVLSKLSCFFGIPAGKPCCFSTGPQHQSMNLLALPPSLPLTSPLQGQLWSYHVHTELLPPPTNFWASASSSPQKALIVTLVPSLLPYTVDDPNELENNPWTMSPCPPICKWVHSWEWDY